MNTDADKEMFLAVKECVSEYEVRAIMIDKSLGVQDKALVDKVFDDEKIMEAIPDFLETGEFDYKDGSLYLIGIDLGIPKLLAKELMKAGEYGEDSYYQALKNFWCWCALNPNATAREDLFGFLERGDFKITKNGFFLGFRNVIKVEDDKERDDVLVKFITDKYMNIKLKQKKSPKNFSVATGDSNEPYYLIHNEKIITLGNKSDVVGNLADLYSSLGNMEENEYTDAHTMTMKIVIGKAVSMERDKCDADPHSECSRGLHVGNKSFGYQSFGNTTILVAINPMNVVAVPKHDANKMRTCEYFPLAVITGDNKYLEDADTLTLEEEYMTAEIDALRAGAFPTTISKNLVAQVVDKLDKYKEVINQRVVEVK